MEVNKEMITIDGEISPWIYIKKIGRIGMWAWDKKAILLDYSMKWVVGTNAEIPCRLEEVPDKIVELFKK